MHTSDLSISENHFLSKLILLVVVALVLVEILRIRDGRLPIPVVEHKLVAEAR